MSRADFLNKEVTVIDNSNYKANYAEEVPFSAFLFEITEYPCYWVRSLVTGKEYELYSFQIKELQEINDQTI